MRRVMIALLAGLLFGAGLVHSGMSDPARVRAFLDLLGGAWDPTLTFVMGGAIVPMAIAWRIRRRLDAPSPTHPSHCPPRPESRRLSLAGLSCSGLGGASPGSARGRLSPISPSPLSPQLSSSPQCLAE